MGHYAVVPALLATVVAAQARAAPPALAPPPETVLAEASSIVEKMKTSERGPYSRLRWYCNDGTVHPPQPYACAERGGGRQHAEYSPERQRLAELGWSVGTVFAALEWDELWDSERRNLRLRELALERYLVDVDDGWVLRKARHYRGRVQVEDEETNGRKLLVRLLSDRDWVAANFLVARELVRVVPHHGGEDRTREIRRLSQELAERDPSFERLRIKIHTTPGPEDVVATRDWIEAARGRGAAAALTKVAEDLAVELEALYGESGGWILEARTKLAEHAAGAQLLPLLESPEGASASRLLERRAQALATVRERVSARADGDGNLMLLDLSLPLEREITRLAFTRLGEVATRSDLLELSRSLVTAAYGAGLLSEREREALARPLARLAVASTASLGDYQGAVRNLRRAGAWAAATIRFSFAEPLARYSALDARAQRFIDHLMRSSPLLALAEAAKRLTADADEVAGVVHRVFGNTVGGTMGLNPGVATGMLRLTTLEDAASGSVLESTDIAVLPETVSELRPVAGILTLAEGNLLSHVQLLARNLGIPNASLTPLVAREISKRAGQEVLLAVGGDGSVVLEAVDGLPVAVRELVRAGRAERTSVKLDAPAPDLTFREPLTLDELSAQLAGRVVGPKAANLGELARLFPTRVEEAIALPFGIFFDHTSRGADSPRRHLTESFEASRASRLDEASLAVEIEVVRRRVEDLPVSPELADRVGALMAERFGPPGSYGVFVRSDTNVEDLPGFTGAGLNLTVPHVVGVDRVLAMIPRVWASPYSSRAMAWRSTILKRPEEVYTSVLLMKSVPAEKSGVMVTADLATRGQGLTIACAWGVGGAVDGEAAETVVLRPDGSTLLVGEAKAPYQRRLRQEGGIEWIVAPAGRVLTPDERLGLRRLAEEVSARLTPATGRDGKPLPWDIEFGFVDGRLALFQIRPLVERGEVLADRVVEALAPTPARLPATVDLAAPPARASQGGKP
jgi:hypothetical protein